MLVVYHLRLQGAVSLHRKGSLYGASRESRVGKATLKEPVTQNRKERNRSGVERDRHIFKKARTN